MGELEELSQLILRFDISPPFAHQPGDTYFTHAHELQQERAGIVISARTYTHFFGTARIEQTELVGGSNIDRFYLEKIMPGQNVTMTGVQENQTTGAVTLKYSNGSNTEYASWEDVGGIADEMDSSPVIAEKLLAMKAFRSSPDGSNKTTQVGAQVSVNGLADAPVVYTEPQ